MSHHILLDLDGTLTDPFLGISRCIRHALAKMDVPAPADESLRRWIGPPLTGSFARHLAAHGGGDAARALTYYRERFAETGLFENTVYKGIPELLSRWSDAGHEMYLATAKPIIYSLRIVEHFGLDRYLKKSYGSELDGRNSDKVDLLQHIVDQQHLDPKSCSMIGDRGADMQAARYHGMHAIGVLWGFGSEDELLEAGAELLVGSPKELFEVIS